MKIIEKKYQLNGSVLKRISLTFLFVGISLSSLFAQKILKAVSQGDLEKVKQLIEADSSLINATNYWKHTPLHKSKNIKITQYLIDKGADVNYIAYNGLAPLHFARDYDIVKLLIDSGADIDIYDKYQGPIGAASYTGTVLQTKIGRAQEKIAVLLIQSGAKLNKRDPNGNTELMIAAQTGCVGVTSCLLEHGADINAVNNNNHTALYFAAKHGYKNVADILIAAGANQNTIAEENYGKPNQLSMSINEREAFLWDLSGRGGYAVKTKNNFMFFTYDGRIDNSAESGLAKGTINPKEIKGQKITMFLFHEIKYKPERVFDIVTEIPDIDIVFGYEPPSTKNIQNVPKYRIAKAHESFTQNGMTVHTIPALAGGVGYLVETDSTKIFFGGLHIGSPDSLENERYKDEIDYLKQFGPIDIAIITTHCHFGKGNNYKPYLYMIDQLSLKEVHLMAANNYQQYLKCANVIKKRNVTLKYPESNYSNGERYHYFKN